jgi:hypothetical protein
VLGSGPGYCTIHPASAALGRWGAVKPQPMPAREVKPTRRRQTANAQPSRFIAGINLSNRPMRDPPVPYADQLLFLQSAAANCVLLIGIEQSVKRTPNLGLVSERAQLNARRPGMDSADHPLDYLQQ